MFAGLRLTTQAAEEPAEKYTKYNVNSGVVSRILDIFLRVLRMLVRTHSQIAWEHEKVAMLVSTKVEIMEVT